MASAPLLSVEPLDPTDEAKTDWRLRVHVPSEISKYVASQGSITIDGISLTVADLLGDIAAMAIIPHTYAVTALHALRPGSRVNIEVDVLAKYAERQANSSAQTTGIPASLPPTEWTVTEEYLLANGY